jgi:hypothetical protein
MPRNDEQLQATGKPQRFRQATWLMCLGFGLLCTLLPILLIEVTPDVSIGQGGMNRVLGVFAGPGMLVSRPLFGIHNLGFFVLTPLVNCVFWCGAMYVVIALFSALDRKVR